MQSDGPGRGSPQRAIQRPSKAGRPYSLQTRSTGAGAAPRAAPPSDEQVRSAEPPSEPGPGRAPAENSPRLHPPRGPARPRVPPVQSVQSRRGPGAGARSSTAPAPASAAPARSHPKLPAPRGPPAGLQPPSVRTPERRRSVPALVGKTCVVFSWHTPPGGFDPAHDPMPGDPSRRIHSSRRKLHPAVADVQDTAIEQLIAGMQEVDAALRTGHDGHRPRGTTDHALHDQFGDGQPGLTRRPRLRLLRPRFAG